MFSNVSRKWNWFVFIPIPILATNSALFMQIGRTLQGTHIDTFGPYFLQIGDWIIYEILCHYLTEISKIFIREYPSKFIVWSSIIHSAAQNHTHTHTHTQTDTHIYIYIYIYIKTELRPKRSQIRLLRCRFYFPMPQLTADCDRFVVLGMPPLEGMDINPIYVVRLVQLIMEIRISEDYCLSDIYVVDYGNITLRHIAKATPSIVKKYELCAFVSFTKLSYANNCSGA